MNGEDNTSNNIRFKVILVGDVNVGKTALFWQFIQGEFLAHKNTLVTTVDFKMKDIMVKNRNIKLYLWDTAGSEQYRSIVATYFKGCHGVAIVFDLSRESSFANVVQYWFPLAKSKIPGSVFILIGNKSDLDIRIPKQEIEKWSRQNGVHYIETSVKLNKNVSEAFMWLGGRMYENESKFEKTQSFNLKQKSIKENKKGKESKCCK